jgi:hypothetical protein
MNYLLVVHTSYLIHACSPLQEAVAYCDKALSLDSSNLKGFMRRSKAQEQLGNFVLAIEDINCCLRIFQSDPDDSA